MAPDPGMKEVERSYLNRPVPRMISAVVSIHVPAQNLPVWKITVTPAAPYGNPIRPDHTWGGVGLNRLERLPLDRAFNDTAEARL